MPLRKDEAGYLFGLSSSFLRGIQAIQPEIRQGLDEVSEFDSGIQAESFSCCVDGVLIFFILKFEVGKMHIGRNVLGVSRDRFGESLAGLFQIMRGGVNPAQLIPGRSKLVIFADGIFEVFGRRLALVVEGILVALREFIARASVNS